MTLKEITTKLGDNIDNKGNGVCCVVTQKSLSERNIYWGASDYKVSGVSGCVIWFVKNS